MKPLALLILSVGLGLVCQGPLNAQQYSIPDKPGESAKIAKQQQKAWTKAAKKQQKAMNKNAKAQRKRDKKAAKKEAKAQSKQSNRNSKYLP
jgi:prophage tail gpP-like protein